jgi:hypothetical protein
MDVTDDEIRELAGSRDQRVSAVSRLKKLVPSEATGRLVTRASVPAPISASEMEVLQRTGELPEKVMKRLTPSQAGTESEAVDDDPRVVRPTTEPPKASARR